MVVGLGSIASVAFGQRSIFSGYGYGVCTADAPENQSVEYSSDYKHLTFTWDAVSFDNCEHTTPATYELKIRENDATLISSYTDLTTTQKTISASSLLSNHAYKFRIRAVATDGTKTDWPDYVLFRTRPNHPRHLTVTPSTRSALISWENVVRSSSLKYYRVLIRHHGHTVYSRHITLGLSKPSTSTIIHHLRPHTTYKVFVRAIAPSSTRGDYAHKRFTTLSL